MQRFLNTISIQIIIVSLYCCDNKSCIEQLTQCLRNEIIINSTSATSHEFIKQFKDTIKYQIMYDTNAEMKRYKEINYYIPDYCLFNSTSDMGICFVVKQRKTGEKLDFVDVFIGEKQVNRWIFSNIGAPSFSFQRKGINPTEPIEIDSLLSLTIEQLVKFNYYSNCKCEKDLNFFEREILGNVKDVK